jgi:hypothetical protein
VIWSPAVCATGALDLAWFLVPVVAFVVIGVLAIMTRVTNRSELSGGLFLLGWIGLGILEVIDGSLLVFLVAFAFPIGAGLAYGVVNRLLRLRDAQDVAMALAGAIKSAPLVAPVVLTVLFLPALTSDVWRIAGALDAGSLLLVGILSVGVLFTLVRAQLGSQVRSMIAQRAEQLSDLQGRSELTRRQIRATAENAGIVLVDEMTDSRVDSAWPAAGEEYAPYLHAAVGPTLSAPLTGRLAITVGVTGILFSGYIYLLCSAVVPLRIAAAWSQARTPVTHLNVLGVSWSLGGGPYLTWPSC